MTQSVCHDAEAESANTDSFWGGRTIVVISPQTWDHIPVSKHHYAVRLAAAGASVVFVEPPTDGLVERSRLSPAADCPGLSVLQYRRPWFYSLRFHFRAGYDFLMSRFVRGLMKEYDIRADVTWCFDCNLYADLRTFGADTVILHPVDPVPYDHQIRPAIHADLILSVSQKILRRFQTSFESRCHIINHGLSEPFVQAAPRRQTSGSRLQFGYVGNLMRSQLDAAAIMTIVKSHPETDFSFWGPYDCENAQGTVRDFLLFLRNENNVKLRGKVTPDELAREIGGQDGFLLAYNVDDVITDNSNSHKILEYLSTGKVVVSKPIEFYADSQLIEMSENSGTESYVRKFNETIANIDHLNAADRQRQRREFALQNTYVHQLHAIEKLVVETTNESH